MRATTDSSSQLMQLGQPESLGMLDHHDGRIRHIHADQVDLNHSAPAADRTAAVLMEYLNQR